MADTDILTGSDLAVKRWSKLLTREAIGRTWLRKFMGTTPASIIQIHRDLEKERGDVIKYDLLALLDPTNYGRPGEATLKGSEVAMSYYQDSVQIDQLRQGIIYGSLSQQRTLHDLRADAKNNLADWWARVLDQFMFAQLAGTGAGNAGLEAILTGGVADTDFLGCALTAVDSAHILDGTAGPMTLARITTLRERAKVGPGGTTPIIRPIRTEDGEDIYVLVLHPAQITSLKNEASGWRTFVQNARERGTSNPLFTGAVGMWDGVVIYESNYVPRGADAAGRYTLAAEGANNNYGIFLGAQAGHIAFGNPYSKLNRMRDIGETTELFTFTEDVDDYGERTGVGSAAIFGMKRAIFNSETYGVQLCVTTDALA